MHSENGEVVVGYKPRRRWYLVSPRGISGHQELRRRCRHDASQRPGSTLDTQVRGVREHLARGAVSGSDDPDDFSRGLHRQGPERHSLIEREGGGAEGDPDTQGDHRRERESRRPSQRADRISQVLQQRFHDASYSVLSAIIGSTPAARRAGMYAAANVAARRMPATTTITNGSLELTPNSICLSTRLPSTAPPSPSTNPTPVNAAPRANTEPMTLCRSAPSAMRMPISRVRRATPVAMSP